MDQQETDEMPQQDDVESPADKPLDKKSPDRKCILTGDIHKKADLIRFVIGPDGAVIPDIASKLPGRGFYIKPTPDLPALIAAGKLHKAISRSLKMSIKKDAIATDLASILADLLAKRVQDRLGQLKRSGLLLTGFDKISEGLKAGAVMMMQSTTKPKGRSKTGQLRPAKTIKQRIARRPQIVYTVADTAADSKRKMEQAAFASHVPCEQFPMDRDPVSQALGLENAVHFMLLEDSAVDGFMADLAKFTALHHE